MSNGLFLTHLSEFAEAHPRVQLVIHLTDQNVDIIEQGYDLAIRLGAIPASSYLTRPLTNMRRRLVASPEYAARHKPPTSPADLVQWRWIDFEPLHKRITLIHDRLGTEQVWGHDQISVNSHDALRALALAGAGLAILSLRAVEQDIAAGRLTQVLPTWRLPSPVVQAVWVGNAPRAGIVVRLVEFLELRTAGLPKDEDAAQS